MFHLLDLNLWVSESSNPRWSHGWCGSTFRFMWILCRREELLFMFRCFFSTVSRWSGKIAVWDGLHSLQGKSQCLLFRKCWTWMCHVFFSNSERWTAWAIPDIWQNPKARWIWACWSGFDEACILRGTTWIKWDEWIWCLFGSIVSSCSFSSYCESWTFL